MYNNSRSALGGGNTYPPPYTAMTAQTMGPYAPTGGSAQGQKMNPYQSALGGGNQFTTPVGRGRMRQIGSTPFNPQMGPVSPGGQQGSFFDQLQNQYQYQNQLGQGSGLGGGGYSTTPVSPFGSLMPEGQRGFTGQSFYGGGGMGPQMGQASPGGFNPGGMSPFSGGLGQTLGRFGASAIGNAFGGPIGGFAAGQLFNRFSGGQQPSPSPFAPDWLGGSGQSTLDDRSQVPFSPAPGNVAPNGSRMNGMGGYRSRAGNVSGVLTPGAAMMQSAAIGADQMQQPDFSALYAMR